MFSLADAPRQDGKVAVVTGANSGLGKETTKALAGKGAHVIMGCRNIAKGEEAKAEILKEQPNASIEVMELNLASI